VTVLPDFEIADEVFRDAAGAAVQHLFSEGANASTILMPSGAGTMLISLQVVLEALRQKSPFRALVVLPRSLIKSAEKLCHAKAGTVLAITTVDHGPRGLHDLEVALSNVAAGILILGSYEDMQRVHIAQRNSRIGPLNLTVLEMAQIVRAGGYREAAMNDGIVASEKRLYISSRHLAGHAPGALLAPEQEPNKPWEQDPWERAPWRFGNEVYKLTHADAAKLNLIVPVRLSFMKSTNLHDIAEELASLHHDIGIRNFAITSAPHGLARRLNKYLSNLTQGVCRATSAEQSTALDVDAIVVAGVNPNYASIAQEFARLAHPSPGKRLGLVLVTAAAKLQVVKAWRALAIEHFDVEEAISQATVAYGFENRRLGWTSIPRQLTNFIYQNTPRTEAEAAVQVCINKLGDPWDTWLGRLKYYRHTSTAKLQKESTLHGYQLGEWVTEQQILLNQGWLSSRKAATLEDMGIKRYDKEGEFQKGIDELKKYVKLKGTSRVSFLAVTESGFRLGEWVVKMRHLQRHGKLSQQQIQLLKEAFFVWRPSEIASCFFRHPEDPDAAVVTRSLEEELCKLRWHPIQERRRHFRKLVLAHHPDVSQDKHAGTTINFLAEVKDWFLATN
jgi:hypothetical protein